MGCALACLTAMLGLSPLDAATIRSVDLGDNAITLRFDDAVEGASAFLLDGPQRLAVDVRGATPMAGAASGGMVAQTRMASRNGAARVVFDLATPALVTGGAFAADGRSLTLLLSPTDARAFARAANGRPQSYVVPAGFRTRPPAGGDRASVTVPLDPPQPFVAPPTPRIVGARADRPLVVIDAGHGGHDPGSTSVLGGRKEKDAALAIAKAVRDELVASGRVRVAMTREDDRFIVLGERREIARRLKADLFISIHADSAPNSAEARGATIYTLSEVASDRVAARLAARENRADVLNGVNLGAETSDVSSILVDLTQRETMNVSSAFADLLQREMSPLVQFKSGYHRFAGLIVLKAPDVPSVLLETGYMSNIDDSKKLFSREGQKDIAVGVRRAVIAHFARRMASR
ncbi:N-acetylmuramoyl-L-alanine amidase [Sphingomonas jatrophae]|uniref:N-acetylmuramoyl-L-alanine amidase n=2 Tax=Sphingomonas jatrophae TaxID=1166337 RepID=A0A1I6JPR4_9SPHN|nr:N-acetylmuramoyl-L-alanine amidase [Sphingomonas jatrophae]